MSMRIILTGITVSLFATITTFAQSPLHAQVRPKPPAPKVLAPAPVIIPPAHQNPEISPAEPFYKYLPFPDETGADAETQNRLVEIIDLLRESGPVSTLPKLDSFLRDLNEPTPIRGQVQFFRANTLLMLDRRPEAKSALEESIRLLPGYTGPLLVSAEELAQSNDAPLAMEYIVRAAAIHPKSIDLLDNYTVSSILDRLSFAGDIRRASKLSATLLQIKWSQGSSSLRSSMAVSVISDHLKSGNIVAAKALIPDITSPSAGYRMLAHKDYESLWPALEQWAGPKMERQWDLYLVDLRARWKASGSPADLKAYASALRAADAPDLLIKDIMPVFDGPIDPEKDFELLFVAPQIATSLAQKGRWNETFALLDKVERIFGSNQTANMLNIKLNRSRLRYFHGDHAAAIEAIDKQIIEIDQFGDEVNADARSHLLSVKICALAELGKRNEAKRMIARSGASTPFVFADMHLCVGDYAQAKAIILRQLKSPTTQAAVLVWAQADANTPIDSDVARARRVKTTKLQNDPDIVRELTKYGRLMPYSPSEGAQSTIARLSKL